MRHADGTPTKVQDRGKWVRLGGFAALALVAGALPSFSLAANLNVAVIGLALGWLGFAGKIPRAEVPERLPATAAIWLVPLGVFGVVELTNLAYGSTYPHPTISILLDPAMEAYPVRAVAFFGWLVAFWGMVRR